MRPERSSTRKGMSEGASLIPLYFLEDAAWGDWPHIPHTFAKIMSQAPRNNFPKKSKNSPPAKL